MGGYLWRARNCGGDSVCYNVFMTLRGDDDLMGSAAVRWMHGMDGLRDVEFMINDLERGVLFVLVCSSGI